MCTWHLVLHFPHGMPCRGLPRRVHMYAPLASCTAVYCCNDVYVLLSLSSHEIGLSTQLHQHVSSPSVRWVVLLSSHLLLLLLLSLTNIFLSPSYNSSRLTATQIRGLTASQALLARPHYLLRGTIVNRVYRYT